MTIKELRECLVVGCNEIVFSYNNKQCGIDISVNDFVPAYQIWYGDYIKEYNSIDALLYDEVFDGKSLLEIWNSVNAMAI